MAITLDDLRTELYARGYDYLANTPGRAERFINGAYMEIADFYPWPFLEASVTQPAPITITDLSRVLSVNDASGMAINYVDRRILGLQDTIFTTTGTPQTWYYEGSDIKVYPVTTGNITVRYVKAATKLVNAGDTVLTPDRFFDAIIDGAVIRALKDDDEYQAVAALRQEWDRTLGNLVTGFAKRQYEPSFILSTRSDWRA